MQIHFHHNFVSRIKTSCNVLLVRIIYCAKSQTHQEPQKYEYSIVLEKDLWHMYCESGHILYMSKFIQSMNFTIPKEPCCKGTIHNPFVFCCEIQLQDTKFCIQGRKEINTCGRCCEDVDLSNEQGMRCLQFSSFGQKKRPKKLWPS